MNFLETGLTESFCGRSWKVLWVHTRGSLCIFQSNSRSLPVGKSQKTMAMKKKTMCRRAKKTCKACFTCPYKVLHQYSLNSTAYSELYTVYHFLLTLAITQVECERSFSKLKLIKTKLRSTMSQENLDSVMLISVESDILNRVSLAKVVDKLASTSKELKRLLTI